MKRQEFLRRSCALGLGAAALHGSGCALIFDAEMLIGSISELEESGFLLREFNWDPIIAIKEKNDIRVFSLTCTHKRCTVEWISREHIFQCPCHEGQYDEQGQVIDGPPPKPLMQYHWERRGEELWVLNQAFREGA